MLHIDDNFYHKINFFISIAEDIFLDLSTLSALSTSSWALGWADFVIDFTKKSRVLEGKISSDQPCLRIHKFRATPSF
jgi:hypothetical protein